MLLDAKFLVRLFLRRVHYFLLVALPVAVLGLWLALNLPPTYRAEARLFVGSPQVPTDLAASTMRAETAEILQVIAQRIQTRPNMLDLSRDFRLHSSQPQLSADAIAGDMRRRVSISLPQRHDAASFITVAFSSPDPVTSAEVTNVLVTQILQQNVTLRTATTTQTLEFFDEDLSASRRS
jgi:polysaccharide biosynthesis transport protein